MVSARLRVEDAESRVMVSTRPRVEDAESRVWHESAGETRLNLMFTTSR
jgi:hypothetical protein